MYPTSLFINALRRVLPVSTRSYQDKKITRQLIQTSRRHNDSSLQQLIEGYKRFRTQHFDSKRTYDQLVRDGQKPIATVICCCDSRTGFETITDCHTPGKFFVLRNIANIVPPFNSHARYQGIIAAIAYGVVALKSPHVIILGHKYCGGIRALMDAPEKKTETTSLIQEWMEVATPAKQRVLTEYPECSPDKQAHRCEVESLLLSYYNLSNYPWIKEGTLNKQLSLNAWYFDLDTGLIKAYQPTTQQFISLADDLINKLQP